MNYRDAIEMNGYRLEDLNDEHRHIIEGMRLLLEDFQVMYQYEDTEEQDTIIGQLKSQIAEEVQQDVYSWLELQTMEYQISFGDEEASDEFDRRDEPSEGRD